MTGLVSVIVAALQYLAIQFSWWPGQSFWNRFPGPIGWIGIALFFLFVGAYLTWKDERSEVLALDRELDELKSVQYAPDIGLALSPNKEIVVQNRSYDRDAHSIHFVPFVTNSGYEMTAPDLAFLKRGVSTAFRIDARRGMDGILWSQSPAPLDPYPENAIRQQIPLTLEFSDGRTDVIYVANFEITFGRLEDPSLRQLRVAVKKSLV